GAEGGAGGAAARAAPPSRRSGRAEMASTYAIVESGGKQYRAEKGGTLLVDRLPAEEGAKVALRAVAFRGDERVVVAAKELEKVKVEAVVAEHLRGPKIRVFKHRPKKGYRRRAGHRSELTKLEVTEVKLLARKPAEPAAKRGRAAAKPARTRAATAKSSGSKPATKKAPARKPAARRARKEGER